MACICDTGYISVTFVNKAWTIGDMNPYRDKNFFTFFKSLNGLWRTPASSSVYIVVLSRVKQKKSEGGLLSNAEVRKSSWCEQGKHFAFRFY